MMPQCILINVLKLIFAVIE